MLLASFKWRACFKLFFVEGAADHRGMDGSGDGDNVFYEEPFLLRTKVRDPVDVGLSRFGFR